jgi:hypothetical protein
MMMYKPHIVHFSAHGSNKKRIILGGAPGRGKEVNCQGLVQMFRLYRNHLRLVILNACFTKDQARSLSKIIDYSVGTGRRIGDKGSVAFAGAFYRALGFGKNIKQSFESAKAELALSNVPRTKGIELFVRSGISQTSRPQTRGTRKREHKRKGSWARFTRSIVIQRFERILLSDDLCIFENQF